MRTAEDTHHNILTSRGACSPRQKYRDQRSVCGLLPTGFYSNPALFDYIDRVDYGIVEDPDILDEIPC